MDCADKRLLWALSIILVAIVLFAIFYNTCSKKHRRHHGSGGSDSDDVIEPFTPESVIEVGNSESALIFQEYGLGTPLRYVGWEGPGTAFQPYVALDQGLYTQGWHSNTELPCAIRKVTTL